MLGSIYPTTASEATEASSTARRAEPDHRARKRRASARAATRLAPPISAAHWRRQIRGRDKDGAGWDLAGKLVPRQCIPNLDI